MRGEQPAHVVKVALGEAAEHAPGLVAKPLHLEVDSHIPPGAGFGSSSATAVGVLAAALAHEGRDGDLPVLDRLALEVERRQHGFPSGADHQAVLRGGMLWVRREPSGSVSIERQPAVPAALSRIQVFDSGRPAESTGTVVAAVRGRRAASPAEFERILDRMEVAAQGLRSQLARNDEDVSAVVELIRECECCLEALGVVPGPVQSIVRRIEAAGGAAKISGAGALSGEGAGCLLVYHADPAAIASWHFLQALPRQSVRLGAAGLRREA